MRMKKYLVFGFAVVGLFFQPAKAHEPEMGERNHEMLMVPPEGGDHAKHFFGMLESELKLSEEQKAKIKAVMSQSQPKLEEHWKKMRELNRDVKEIMHEESEKIRATLSPGQREKFDDMKEQMRRRRCPMTHEGDHRRRMPGKLPEAEPAEEPDDEPDAAPEHDHSMRDHIKRGARGMPDDLPPPEMYQGRPDQPAKPENPQ